MASNSYLDKVFRTPDFIWNNGVCDLELVGKSVTTQLEPRLALLAQKASIVEQRPTTEPEPVHTPLALQPTPTAVNESSSAPDLLSSVPNAFKVEIPNAMPQQPEKKTAATRSAVMPLISDVWNASEPINYHTQFQIGTVAHTFFLDIDSGSSLLWLQALLSDASQPIPDQNMYNPRDSTTSASLNQTRNTWYGDGTNVSLSLYTDTITIGQLTSTSQLLGAAEVTDLASIMKASKANGLIGLGFPIAGPNSPDAPATDAIAQNLVRSLQAAGKLKYASFSIIGPRTNPVDAIAIDKNQIMQPRGHFVIGSVDPSFYTGTIAWCPTLPNADRWKIALDEVRINGKTAFTNQTALIDTGTAYMLVSPTKLAAVAGAISGAKIVQRNPIFFAYPDASVQSVSFVFGGREILLHPSDFSLGHIKEDLSKDGGGTNETGLISSICSINSKWPFDEDMWVIGGIFLDNVVTIFDFAEMKLGFADISETDMDDPRFAQAA